MQVGSRSNIDFLYLNIKNKSVACINPSELSRWEIRQWNLTY